MLTSNGKYEQLRVEMVDKSNIKKYAVYKTFMIGDAASKYKLTVGDYSGNAGKLKFGSVITSPKICQENCSCTISKKFF